MATGILSWNMQGWGRGNYTCNIKLRSFFHQMALYNIRDAIIAFQECGNEMVSRISIGTTITNPETKEDYICRYIVKDPTAKAYRCSTAILTHENRPVSEAGELCPAGVNRPFIYVVSNNILVGTVHAIADQRFSVSEIKQILNTLEDMRDTGRIGAWIIIGDFNSKPEAYTDDGNTFFNQMNRVQIAGSSTRLQRYAWMIKTRYATQGAGGRRTKFLDFAFLSENMGGTIPFAFNGRSGELIGNEKIFNASYGTLSDHNMIGFCL